MLSLCADRGLMFSVAMSDCRSAFVSLASARRTDIGLLDDACAATWMTCWEDSMSTHSKPEMAQLSREETKRMTNRHYAWVAGSWLLKVPTVASGHKRTIKRMRGWFFVVGFFVFFFTTLPFTLGW